MNGKHRPLRGKRVPGSQWAISAGEVARIIPPVAAEDKLRSLRALFGFALHGGRRRATMQPLLPAGLAASPGDIQR